MLDGIHGNRRAALEAELARPHAGTNHDLFRRHVALGRGDADRSAVFAEDARHAHAFGDRRAALFSAAGQGKRRLLSVHAPLRGQPHRAEHVLRLQQRPLLFHFLGRDELHVQPRPLRHGDQATELNHPRFGLGEHERTGLLPLGGDARLLFERRVELGAGVDELAEARLRRAAHQSRGERR